MAGTLDVGVLSSRGDVDGDGDMDLSDFGVMKSEFGKVTGPDVPELLADLNGDTRVDLTDFGILKDNFGKHQPALAIGLPGDANGDGRIDLSDFGILKQYFGLRGIGIPADFNQDGTVNLDDFGIFKNSINRPAPAPEPSTLLLATVAGVGLLACRRSPRSLRLL